MSEDLRQKIIDIICKESGRRQRWIPALRSDIYERLREGRASTSPTTPSTKRAGRALVSRGRTTLTFVPHGETPGSGPAQEAARPSMT
jgi:hypothetical protein